jgi:hypothetical protein
MTLACVAEHAPEGFTLDVLWAGERVKEEVSVSPDELCALARSGSLRNAPDIVSSAWVRPSNTIKKVSVKLGDVRVHASQAEPEVLRCGWASFSSAPLILQCLRGGAGSGSRWTVASTHHFGLIPRFI